MTWLDALNALSMILLASVLFSYLWVWWQGYREALLDPGLQTDDAQTALFPFHRYAAGAPLANDPIANEMIAYQPYAYRLLYRFTVPFVGLLAASKLVQGLCLVLVLAAGVILARSKRAGLGAGALLVFLFFRDTFIMNRIGGGLPRSFGFPAMAIWLAGCLAHSVRARRTGAVIAALTYPSALAMVLGAEGIYALRSLGRAGIRTAFRRIRHYVYLAVACAALFAPVALFDTSDGGPVHTMEQARQDPAFGKSGRLWVLPLRHPGEAFGQRMMEPFKPYGESPIPPLQEALVTWGFDLGLVVLALCFCLSLWGVAPAQAATVALFSSSLMLYAASVVFAFRLYSPERYYRYGGHVVIVAILLSAAGLLLPRLRYALRQPVRNFGAALVILSIWSIWGTGIPTRAPMAMTMRSVHREPLWDFLKTLPHDVRIASFMTDGDGIPLFGQRATNGGYETMQPWLTKSWARQRERAQDTLRALYATNRADVLDYAEKYGITHFFLNRARYRHDFVSKAKTFEPMTSFARELLSDRKLEDLVLAEPPQQAIVFEMGRFVLIDVKKLAEAWGARL
jgi:hypothetical protein